MEGRYNRYKMEGKAIDKILYGQAPFEKEMINETVTKLWVLRKCIVLYFCFLFLLNCPCKRYFNNRNFQGTHLYEELFLVLWNVTSNA